MSHKLTPCPFCGNTGEVHAHTFSIDMPPVHRAWVECESCAAQGPPVSSDKSEDEAGLLAVMLWNRRKDRDGYTIDNEAGDDDPAGWS